MTAVVVSLVAIVLLVLVVVALGMRSMSRRESSLPPERLKEMAEKEEKTHARSTDEFASHEPRMANFSPDFSPIDAPKQPKPVRTGQRGKRGVDEWGNPVNDEDDEEFWANIRSDAEQGGFGAGGTVAARKAASRPGEPASERPAERPGERPAERQPQRAAERPGRQDRSTERPSERRAERKAKPRPVAASVDPDATTIQAPLPQRPAPAAAAANLADLVEPGRRTPSQAELAEQRTVTFAAPTPDVMSILGAGAQPVPAARPEPSPAPRSSRSSRSRSRAAASPAAASPAAAAPAATPATAGPAATSSGSYPAISSNSATTSGSFPAATPTSSGSFPAASPTSSGSFPIAHPAPIHGAPTSDPFPAAYTGAPADALDTTWTTPAPTSSGSWPAGPVADILDDAAPAAASYPGPASSWPAFEQPASRSSYPASYEVRPGWAVADDSDPVTGPTPAAGTPTVPNRAVSASGSYPDVLSTPTPASPPSAYPAYETGDITSLPASAWPEPPAAGGAQVPWPGYGAQPQPAAPQAAPNAADATPGGRRRREQDYPHDYYR
jgi:Na+-transporting methylmalonyl-CoA/oxaloacetate decarboxylase gamma subunit